MHTGITLPPEPPDHWKGGVSAVRFRHVPETRRDKASQEQRLHCDLLSAHV